MDGMNIEPDKSLGQHWLKDEEILSQIVDYADVKRDDVILEIGPGLGTMTQEIAKNAGRVVAVEFDKKLADNLRTSEKLNKNVIVKNEDFLKFDLSGLSEGYKIIGNIPYYITGKIVRKILSSVNRPQIAVLLVQKEVAQRIAAGPDQMSALSVIAQYYSEVSLGVVVPASKFTPAPKVDSQVVILKPYSRSFREMHDVNLEKKFLTVVKAGFSARRKKLHSSISGGLGISVEQAKQLLADAKIDSNLRAQNLDVNDWISLAKKFNN